jgi:hypothetical protein
MRTDLAQLRQDLAELRGDLPAIAYKAGVSYSTLSVILRGIQTNPTLKTFLALRQAVDDFKQTAGANA